MSSWPQPICPTHKSPLVPEKDKLLCPQGHHFDIVNSIPRFVAPSSYADSFGAQWHKYRLTQLDSFLNITITRDRTRRALGEHLWNNLAGKQVLECGCGAGRFTEVLLSMGCQVTSIDLSNAVDANQINFPQNAQHRICQADIMQLPFSPRQFDVVFCLGVIQHTPFPEKTITALHGMVKDGGYLVIDHYMKTIWHYFRLASLLRLFLKRLPASITIPLTRLMVAVFLPMHKLFRNFYPGHALLSRISPVLCYYHMFPDLDDKTQYEWALLDTHDSLTDWYKHRRSKEEIRKTLEQLGLEEISSEYEANIVEARGRRPAPAAKA